MLYTQQTTTNKFYVTKNSSNNNDINITMKMFIWSYEENNDFPCESKKYFWLILGS